MTDKTFTKKELLEMWQRSPERQQNVCASKIMEAINLTNGDIAICFSGGKDSSYLLYRYCQIISQFPKYKNKKVLVLFANTTNETSAMKKHISSFIDFLKEKFEIDIEFKETKPKDNITWVEIAKTKGIPFPTKQVAGSVRKVKKELQRLNIDIKDIEHLCVSSIEARDALRNMGFNNTAIYYLTGWSCQSKSFSSRYKLPKQWFPLLWDECPVNVTEECCVILKERPMQNLKHPNMMTGEMAEESTTREQEYLKHGCNKVFDNGSVRSKPMGSMTTQGVLFGIKYFNIPICADYGDIVCENGKYKCTGCDRTGCKLCGFGTKYDTERFIRLQKTEPATINFAFKPLEKGGLGYKELIEFSNKYCGTKIAIPELDWSDAK
jgi:3'-phosphoadenosine 5'-phosphosulfate sulfotransferase (PAPS reductase)/FAD synthetase